MKKLFSILLRFRFLSFRVSILYPVLFLAVFAIAAIIGCGGGGGGGGGGNPVGPGIGEEFADLNGIVTFNGVPMAESAVYLIKPEAALQSGVSQAFSFRQPELGQTQSKIGDAQPSELKNVVEEASPTRNSAIVPDANYGDYRTVSDEKGGFQFKNVRTGEYTLVAVKNANQQAIRTGVIVGAITTVDVQLTPTGNLNGKIEAPGLADLTGTLVFLNGTSYVGLTSSDGGYSLLNIPAGTYNLRAQRSGYSTLSPISVTVVPAVTTTVPNQALSPIVIPANSGGVSGSVLRQNFLPGDTSHAGTIVFVAGTPFLSVSASDGSYGISGIPTGTYAILFPSDQYYSNSNPTVTVVAGQIASVPTVLMTPKNPPIGVGGLDGNVFKSIKVQGQTDESGIIVQLASASGIHLSTTNALGTFQFKQIPVGDYELSFKSELYKVASAAPIVVTVASPSGSALGLFRFDPSLAPTAIGNLSGFVFKSRRIQGQTDESGIVVQLASASAIFLSTTDASGAFQFNQIPVGDYGLSFKSELYKVASATPINVSTANFSGASLGLFRLDPIEPPTNLGDFSGVVFKSQKVQGQTDESGVVVQLASSNGNYLSTTDITGLFQFKRIPLGAYGLSFKSELYQPASSTPIPVMVTDPEGPRLGIFSLNPTDINSADTTPPTLVSFSPTGRTNFFLSRNSSAYLSLFFNENVFKGASGNIVFKKSSNGSVVETIPVNDSKITVTGSLVEITASSTFPDESYYVEMSSGCFRDLSGNYFAGITGASTWSFTSDTVKPTLVFTTTASNPTRNSPVPITVTFSEPVSDFSLSNVAASSPIYGDHQVKNLQILTASQVWTFDVIPIDGTFTVNLQGSVLDLAQNPYSPPTPFSIVYDVGTPSVFLTSSASSATNVSPIPVTITFNKDVTGFDISDIVVGSGTPSNLQMTTTNRVWTVDVSPDSQGVVTVNIPASSAQDLAGNWTAASSQLSKTYDSIQPSVVLTTTAASITKTTPLTVTITFSETISGFSSSDITVVNGSKGSLSTITSNKVFSIPITLSTNGTVTVDIAAGAVQDSAGNQNTAATQLSRIYDKTAPTLVISTTASEPTNVSPIPVIFTFSEDVTGFIVSDITVVNGSAGNFQGGPKVYTSDVTPIANGAVTMSVTSSKYTDIAGNSNTTTASLISTYDTTPPTVALSTLVGSYTNSSPFTVTMTFSENVTGFSAGDISVVNGAASNLLGGPKIYTANITPSGQGSVDVTVPAGSAQDSVGYPNSVSSQLNVVYDTVSPGVTLTSTAPLTLNSPFAVTISFDEVVSSSTFTLADLTVGRGSADGLQVVTASQVWRVTISPASLGTVTVDLAAGKVQDRAGNQNTAATQLTRGYDPTPPSVTLTTDAPNPTNATIPVTVTFSEAVTGFTLSDLSITNGSGVNFTETTSNTEWMIDIVPTATGTVTIGLPADVAQNSIGNGNTVATSITRIFDNVNPTVVLTTTVSDPTLASVFPVTITFSEEVSGFIGDNINVANASKGDFQVLTANKVWKLFVIPTAVGSVTIDIPYGATNDPAGNANATATTLSRQYNGLNFSTVAGTVGSPGSTDDGAGGGTAKFSYPFSLGVDSARSLVFVADRNNHTIRKINAGIVSTVAGSGGVSGSADGTGSAARFYFPSGLAVASSGNVYVADTSNHTIRKLTFDAVGVATVTTIAGIPGISGSGDGIGAESQFYQPSGVAVDNSGNVYVADTSNNTIRKISAAGVVTTLAGLAGNAGSANGTGTAARFNNPLGIAVDGSGNVFVGDNYNHTVRKITSAGVVTTFAGLAGSSGSADGSGSTARFNYPAHLAIDSSGNIYVADKGNHLIRMIDNTGEVISVAGVAGTSGSVNGLGAGAFFLLPYGVAVDSSGNVWVADTVNHTVRQGQPGGI
ncbi:hypothetical protein HYY75_09935 [bacterium]|nr:hypothetical protein [bacterium]